MKKIKIIACIALLSLISGCEAVPVASSLLNPELIDDLKNSSYRPDSISVGWTQSPNSDHQDHGLYNPGTLSVEATWNFDD